MAMAMNCLWIALLVTLQISVGLCRSTEKPHIEEKGTTSANALVVGAAWPSQMAYSDNFVRDTYYYEDDGSTAVIVIFAIIIPVFIFLSLILGCIMYCCCKKKPRPGYIVFNNTGGQGNEIQPPRNVILGYYGTVRTMQQYPEQTLQYLPPNGQRQQYPPPIEQAQQYPTPYGQTKTYQLPNEQTQDNPPPYEQAHHEDTFPLVHDIK